MVSVAGIPRRGPPLKRQPRRETGGPPARSQDILGYSAFQAGLRFLPLTILIILAAPVSGRLSARVPPRVLTGGGLILIAAGPPS